MAGCLLLQSCPETARGSDGAWLCRRAAPQKLKPCCVTVLPAVVETAGAGFDSSARAMVFDLFALLSSIRHGWDAVPKGPHDTPLERPRKAVAANACKGHAQIIFNPISTGIAEAEPAPHGPG
jgi:hypothetical protein